MTMNWNNINTENSLSEQDNINWKNRYKFVINSIDDFGYVMSRSRVKKVGQVYVGICPFPTHNEKTGSFTIYPHGYTKNGVTQEHTSFYCFGCGEGGDVIKFKQLYDGLKDKKEACKILENEHDLNVNDEDIRQILLKESLESVKNSAGQVLTFANINLICSKICKNYLSFVKANYDSTVFDNEFEIIQDFYKYFDNEILDLTMDEAGFLIDMTNNVIDERIRIITENNTNNKTSY